MSSGQQTMTDSPAHDTGMVIETSRLTRYFGAKKAVDSLTMSVPRGCVFAFLGRNGSGKTSTIRMLLGLTAPTRGSSRLMGQDSQHLTSELRARVGYMSESHTLNDWMTVRQMGEYQSAFYARWNPKVFGSIVEHFRLDPRTRAGSLSRGERAGLALAITLAPEPELLILDDPALGLDPVARRSLLESMIYVTRGSDRTIFFSSHLLDDVERVADYVAILDRSVLRACCPVDLFRASVKQFVLHFAADRRPAETWPPIRGLLNTQRIANDLRLTIANTTHDTRAVLSSLGAASIDETEVSFSDALIGYLGERGERGSFFEPMIAGLTGGAA
jgi:ABC-2 type transport system ATP-binding protein